MPQVRRNRPPPAMDRSSTPTTLWVLMGLNVLVYVLWTTMGLRDPAVAELMQAHFTVSLGNVMEGRVWTLLTSVFSHYDATHLLFNMLALWVFGKDVYRVVGKLQFLHLYLVGGLLASLAHVGASWFTGDPTGALGASGAVMAIAVLFGALFPRRKLLINFIIPMPAALAVAAYVVMDVAGLFAAGSGIAHAAHLGGAVYGLGYWLTRVRPKVGRRTR